MQFNRVGANLTEPLTSWTASCSFVDDIYLVFTQLDSDCQLFERNLHSCFYYISNAKTNEFFTAGSDNFEE